MHSRGIPPKDPLVSLKPILMIDERSCLDSQSQQAVTHPMAALSDPGIGSYWLQSFSKILTSSQSSSSEPSRQSLSPLHTRWRFRQRPEQGEVVDASRASRTTPPPS